MPGQTPARIAALASPLLSRGISLLAEKVEDKTIYDRAREAGFRYFQGYYFSRPEVVSGRKPPVGVVSKVRLLRELAHPDNDGNRLEGILSSDPGLSFRLLKYLNSAAFFRLDKITSLSHAMTVMGQNQLRKWLMAVVLSDMAHTPLGREVSFQSLTRARFLELLTNRTDRLPYGPDSLFMVGLFSRMDSLLANPWTRLPPSFLWTATSWPRYAASPANPERCSLCLRTWSTGTGARPFRSSRTWMSIRRMRPGIMPHLWHGPKIFWDDSKKAPGLRPPSASLFPRRPEADRCSPCAARPHRPPPPGTSGGTGHSRSAEGPAAWLRSGSGNRPRRIPCAR